MAKVARDRTGRPRYQGTLSVKSFEFERKLGEGTFGCVLPLAKVRTTLIRFTVRFFRPGL